MSIYPADEYRPSFGLDYPFFTDEVLSGMTEEDLKRALEAKLIAEQNARIDPLEFGWILPSWREFMQEWDKYSLHCVLGGKR